MSTEDDNDSETCHIRSGSDEGETITIMTEGTGEMPVIKAETIVNFPKPPCHRKDQTISNPPGSSLHNVRDETIPDPRKSSSYLREEITPDPLKESLCLDRLFASDHPNSSYLETEVISTSPKSSCNIGPEAISNPMETTPCLGDESTSDGLEYETTSDSLKLFSHFENKAACAYSKSASRLESLPAELRVLLLSWMPDLPTLHSLINASPVLHAQYRKTRDTLLFTCLSKELDGYYADAFATLRSQVTILGPKRTDDMCEQFLSDDYDTILSGKYNVEDFDRPSGGQIR